MAFRTLDDLGDIRGKRALVRVDLNVPMADGRVTDETRLRALLPTVTELADKGAKVLLLAHFGRPKGAKHSEMSVSMVLDALQKIMEKFRRAGRPRNDAQRLEIGRFEADAFQAGNLRGRHRRQSFEALVRRMTL